MYVKCNTCLEISGTKGVHNVELYNFNPPTNIIRIIKSRTVRLARHVARLGEKNINRILVGTPENKREYHRRTILKWNLDEMECYGPD
jgi:hypothetical protein